MRIRQLLTEDENAVSPVIGVILMVAITVILAAVIGTFVLGLGQNLQQTAPQASFTFDFNQDGAANDAAITSITHDGGDTIDSNRLTTKVDGSDVGTGSYTYQSGGWSGDVTAGSSVTVVKDDGTDSSWSGETIKVIWTSDAGDNSATLGESKAPS